MGMERPLWLELSRVFFTSILCWFCFRVCLGFFSGDQLITFDARREQVEAGASSHLITPCANAYSITLLDVLSVCNCVGGPVCNQESLCHWYSG